jgi:phosphate transport system substrate-binding protein
MASTLNERGQQAPAAGPVATHLPATERRPPSAFCLAAVRSSRVARLAGISLLGALIVAAAAAAGCRPAGRGGTTVNVIGSTTVLPIAQAAAEEFNAAHPADQVLVQGGGSSAGIEAVSTGRAQIGTSSRDLKPGEASLHLTDIPIAVDVIAVIVNPDNPVSELSLSQLAGIYQGRITNWKQVGGRDALISLVNRDEASGTRDAFSKMVLGGKPFDPYGAVLPGTGQVRSIVAGSAEAIGYISLGYVTDEVKTVSIDGAAPTVKDVRQGTYALRRKLHFVVKGRPNPVTQEFIDFVLSDQVQNEIVAKAFLPIMTVIK